MLRVIQIEIRQLDEANLIAEFRIRGSGNHIDLMPQIGQSFTQMLGIDTLTAACGISPIGQETNSQRTRTVLLHSQAL